MAAEENIETSRRALEEAFGEGRFEVLDEICADGYVGHDPIAGDQDLAAVKETIRSYRDAFPDLSFTVEDAFGADDKVVMRWKGEGTFEHEFLGQQPTGEKGEPTEGISIDRYDQDGMLVETWNQWDTVGFMRTIGALPAGAAAASA